MKLIDKDRLLRYIITNIVISSLIFLVKLYSGPFIEGPWFTVKLFLDAPAFIIIALLKGVNSALHFTTENLYRIVSFIFYSTVIAMIQILIYKNKRRSR
jgi:hypothetical protein